jgi:hypothetical protein
MARESGVVDVVISFGAIDEGVTRTSDDEGFPGDLADLGGRWDRVYHKLKLVWDSFPSNVRLHLLYEGSQFGWLVDALTRFAAERPGLSALHASVDSLSGAITARTDGADIPRVLVVGDSTSVRLAVALFRASAGQLDVRWVGANGCPFVDAVSIRPSLDDPWEVLWCRSNIELVREQLDTFVPDVVVLMVAPAELGFQKYEGDDRSHVAGDPAFTQIHDDHMEAFIAPLSERGTVLLVADCPQMRSNEITRATDEMMSPERIALWNAQVQRWVDSSPEIALLPYAAAINEYESTIGEVLHDGMHPDVDILTEIMPGKLLDVILAAARRN